MAIRVTGTAFCKARPPMAVFPGDFTAAISRELRALMAIFNN